MSFSFVFTRFVAISFSLVSIAMARNSFDSQKTSPVFSSKQQSYSSKKEKKPTISAPSKIQPLEPFEKPEGLPARQPISLLGTHHAPQAFGNAVLSSVDRNTALEQIMGTSVAQLFGPHFLDNDHNFITTLQQPPLTPERTASEYRPEGIFTLLLNNGTPFSWGELFPSTSIKAPVLPAGRSVLSMVTSRFAVTTLLDDGSLVSWGKDQSSLTSVMEAPPVPSGTKVLSIASTPVAFAALLDNGKILAWGNQLYGGLAPEIPTGKKAIALFSNGWAFAALLNDYQTVISWGGWRYGGSGLFHSSEQIRDLVSTDAAFAVLTIDGQIEVWGDPNSGGTLPTVPTGIVDRIIPNEVAFTALLHDGTLFCWGDPTGGGTTPTIPSLVTFTQSPNSDSIGTAVDDETATRIELSTPDPMITINPQRVVSVVGNERAFAALLNDGTLIAWGDPNSGGVAPTLSSGKVFTSIVACQQGFSAFFEGGVLCWSKSMPQGMMVDLPRGQSMESLATTREAFAASFSDGTLHCWGIANCGGTTPYLFGKKVTALTSNDHAFLALTEDGTPVAWGEGASSILPSLPQDRQILSLVSPFFQTTFHFNDELSGVVVINNSVTTQGSWQYAEPWSEVWTTIPAVASSDSGFALNASTRIRFVPASDFSGAAPPLIVKLLDATMDVQNGTILNVTSPDPAAPYSVEAISLSTTVTKSFWESFLGR